MAGSKGGGCCCLSNVAVSAPWISGSDTDAAPWVSQIEQELLKKEYWMIYANDPRTPQKEAIRLLNRAARAYEASGSGPRAATRT